MAERKKKQRNLIAVAAFQQTGGGVHPDPFELEVLVYRRPHLRCDNLTRKKKPGRAPRSADEGAEVQMTDDTLKRALQSARNTTEELKRQSDRLMAHFGEVEKVLRGLGLEVWLEDERLDEHWEIGYARLPRGTWCLAVRDHSAAEARSLASNPRALRVKAVALLPALVEQAALRAQGFIADIETALKATRR